MELSRPTQKNGSLQTYSLPKEWNSPDLLLTKRMELSRPTQKNGSLQTYILPKEWSSLDNPYLKITAKSLYVLVPSG
jgi:hypothetical protein